MKEIFEALSSRIKSPLFGYAVIAFVAINWRPLFYLIAANETAIERIKYFENNTTLYSLILLPIFIAAFGAIIYPWINALFLFLCKKPTDLRNSIQALSEHSLMIKKQELEEVRSTLLKKKEQELIERAKRDEELESIVDSETKEKIKAEIVRLREERDQLSHEFENLSNSEKNKYLSKQANSPELFSQGRDTMADQTCNWTGASGKKYLYHVEKLPVSFKTNQNGNYIYTKIVNTKWSPIYIGEGDLGDRIGPNHQQANCIKSKGATHVHTHLNSIERDRKTEERDLLANYTNAYTPHGCNERIGG